MDSLVGSTLGIALCTAAGCAGALAAVFGKLAGQEHIDTPTQILFYVLLISVSARLLPR